MPDNTKLTSLDYKQKYALKQMELNSLLEITQAINNNMSEDNLYKIYEFTIRANQNISQLVLIVNDQGDWEQKVIYGVNTVDDLLLNQSYFEVNDVTAVPDPSVLQGFEWVIPVKHKNNMLAIVLVAQSDTNSDELNTTFLQAISNLIIVAIENKKMARAQLEEESFRKELEIAKGVQKLLFPDKLPDGNRLKMQASYLPHHSIGGDYYDYIPINANQFLICIADVSGKGIPAAIMMSNFQASLHTLLRQTSNLTEIVEALNFQIMENAKGDQFITFFGAIYDHNLNTLVYVNSGHNPPYLVNGAGKMIELTEGSTVLGAFDELPFINEGFIDNLDSFTLFAYTDGLTETENLQGEEFGNEPLEEYFSQNYSKPLTEIHNDILAMVDNFRQAIPYRDDITMLSCKVEAR
ncbi:Serine phosphatase RsbU, regulator of sigma subunit [hydrothermal vent metagenome]|uniref:Serine phosphatase RsbU, regulator of sigma subunit n=1 Tax=hydrothermal vent metagenome TaxID=652676 RepID=A0A3B0VAZ3_9ZZZZ